MSRLLHNLRRALPADLAGPLDALAASAARAGTPLYLVGGAVRDLLLERPLKDLDLVVEGDAIALARSAAQALGGDVTTHPDFGTATLALGRQRLDLATARTETYARPGALPTVRPGSSIHDDLRRRDFTINAIALRLSPPDAGALVDPFHGQADLEQRAVRVLHDASFRDDATRILRAVRYEQRLAFAIEPYTLALLHEALAQELLDTISGDRLRHELALTLEEPNPAAPLLRMAELGVWPGVYPPLDDVPGLREGLREVGRLSHTLRGLLHTGYLWHLGLLALPLPADRAPGLVQRLAMPRRWAQVVTDTVALAGHRRLDEATATPLEVCEALDKRAPGAVWALALADPRPLARERVRRYLLEWRHLQPQLSGSDLLALGVPQGPQVGRWLRELRAARLEGRVATRADEEALVRAHLGL